jgi:hypothetical protein
MKRIVRSNVGVQLAMASIAFAIAALIDASAGVVYLIGLAIVAVNIGLLAHEEGIDIRRTVYNPFRALRRKP